MNSSLFRQRLVLHVLKVSQRRTGNLVSQGFTLIELLVVIIILGVLGAVGYAAYLDNLGTANANVAQVAATSAAKSCAAAQIGGSIFNAGVDNTRVKITPATCATGQSFVVTAGYTPAGGTTAYLRTATAQINSDGAVIPGL